MAEEETPDGSEERQAGGREAFGQDPFVERLRPDPSAPPSAVVVLEGLGGNSDRDGWVRLYFDRSLTYYAEFRREDIVFTEPIPPEQAPMLGLKATRVGLRRDAVLEYTRATRARPRDEFDLDIRLAAAPRRPGRMLPAETWEAECPGPTWDCDPTRSAWCGDTVQITICRGATCVDVCDTRWATCDTCRTDCGQDTCVTCGTCQTQCGQATCATCQTQCGTCQTQCGQATCATCQTQCGQATCATCRTDCGGRTCVTCGTCNPHVFTCGPNPQCW